MKPEVGGRDFDACGLGAGCEREREGATSVSNTLRVVLFERSTKLFTVSTLLQILFEAGFRFGSCLCAMAQVEDAAISERSLLWLVAVWSAAAVILLHWFWVLYRSYCWKYRLPGPSIPLPFFLGHVVHIFLCVEIDFSRLHVGMYKMLLALDYSKIGRLWLGPREIVAITDPETFRRMLGSKYVFVLFLVDH